MLVMVAAVLVWISAQVLVQLAVQANQLICIQIKHHMHETQASLACCCVWVAVQRRL